MNGNTQIFAVTIRAMYIQMIHLRNVYVIFENSMILGNPSLLSLKQNLFFFYF